MNWVSSDQLKTAPPHSYPRHCHNQQKRLDHGLRFPQPERFKAKETRRQLTKTCTVKSADEAQYRWALLGLSRSRFEDPDLLICAAPCDWKFIAVYISSYLSVFCWLFRSIHCFRLLSSIKIVHFFVQPIRFLFLMPVSVFDVSASKAVILQSYHHHVYLL